MIQLGACVYMEVGNMDKHFADLTAKGLYTCQLMTWNRAERTDAAAKEVLAAAEKYHVTITALWCGWGGPCVWDFYDGQDTLGLVPVTYRCTRIDDLKSGSDFAEKIGVTDVVTHMGFIPENPHDPNYHSLVPAIRFLANYMKEKNQYLLFETGQETPVTLIRLFEDVGTGNLAVNLDPANLILYGKANPVDALDVFGKYVRGVHGKDGMYPTNGKELGQEVPLGEGKVCYERLIKGLIDCGYDGAITIEREIVGDQQQKDIIAARDMLTDLIKKYSK